MSNKLSFVKWDGWLQAAVVDGVDPEVTGTVRGVMLEDQSGNRYASIDVFNWDKRDGRWVLEKDLGQVHARKGEGSIGPTRLAIKRACLRLARKHFEQYAPNN